MFENLKIGTRLFIIAVLGAVIPILIVAVVVGFFISQAVDRLKINAQSTRDQIAGDIIGENLKGQSAVTARQIDAYLSERMHDVAIWATDPLIRQAARDASDLAVMQGLPDLSVEEVEKRMDSTRALTPYTAVFKHMQELVISAPVFSEVFFTEKHGYTVAYSEITSDFVQKGEDWWEQAWATGSYLGQVAYDDSAGVYSVEIAVRITDDAGANLGVLKAVLDVRALQALVLEGAGRIQQGTLRIVTSGGNLVADTGINNDPNFIMQNSGNLLKRNWAAFKQIIEDGQDSGYLLDQASIDGPPVIIGYSRTAPGTYYQVLGFDGFDWYVTVEQPSQVALAPLDGMKAEISDLEATRRSIMLLFLIMSVVTAGLSMVFAYTVTRGITKPIGELADSGQRFSSGDMDVSIAVRHKNEIGILESTFQQMIVRLRAMLLSERNEREYMERTVRHYLEFMRGVSSGNLKNRLPLDDDRRPDDDPLVQLGMDLNLLTESLHDMIIQVQDTANQLASSSTEILSATTQQASGASEQSAAISQTTTTVDEVKTIAEVSAMRAQEVANSAQETVQTSQTGRSSVEATIESMTEIKDQVERIAENILSLSEQMQQIGEIIATVSGIASQSNMLALNASVEAARAGEQGRGFAVVAAEVRSLAEQSQQATAQIKTILQDIQKATNTTVMATEEGTKGVERGVRLAFQARAVIEQLSEVIKQSSQNAVQMVAAGQQQTAGVEQVALAMSNINQATMQSLASTRQAEKAAHNLHELALQLTETIRRYQV